MIARKSPQPLLGRLREGRLEIAEQGAAASLRPGRRRPEGAVLLHDSSFWRGLTRGSLGLAESYGRGGWDCDDLVSLVRIGAREMPRVDRLRRPLVPLLDLLSRVPRNTRAAARRHIAAHYDLGNALFELFLDDHDLFVCGVRGPRGHPARSSAGQARPGLPQARADPEGPRGGDRHGLGLVRAARGGRTAAG